MSVDLTPAELAGIRDTMRTQGVEVGDLDADLITSGRSNLTYRLSDGERRWVMRTPPRAGRTPSAHDVAREWRVTRALGPTDVPVAGAVALEEDEALLGGAYAIWDFVDGTCLQDRADLDAVDDAGVAAIGDALADALARLHRVDHVAAGLERFGRPDGYAARQLRRWSGQWEIVGPAFDADTRAAAERLCTALADRLPEQRSTGIVHGDYRIDNTLLDLAGTPRVQAIVDWELSTIGDPAADVAMTAVYRHPVFDRVHGRPTAATSPRLPDAAGFAAAYERAGGVPLVDWERHLALAYFKIAVIAAGIDHRYRAGGTSGGGFDTAGAAVPVFLEAGSATLGA